MNAIAITDLTRKYARLFVLLHYLLLKALTGKSVLFSEQIFYWPRTSIRAYFRAKWRLSFIYIFLFPPILYSVRIPAPVFSIQQPFSFLIWNIFFKIVIKLHKKELFFFVCMTGKAIRIKIASTGKRAQGSSHGRHSPVLIIQCIRCDFRKICDRA